LEPFAPKQHEEDRTFSDPPVRIQLARDAALCHNPLKIALGRNLTILYFLSAIRLQLSTY
jgi:hypothetical protein